MARYTDIPAVMQVIGSIYQNPSLLDNEKYNFTEEDFTEDSLFNDIEDLKNQIKRIHNHYFIKENI